MTVNCPGQQSPWMPTETIVRPYRTWFCEIHSCESRGNCFTQLDEQLEEPDDLEELDDEKY